MSELRTQSLESAGMVRHASLAMATRFEVVLWGGSERYLRDAAEQAMEEIHRLERQLSLYRDDSEVRYLNVRAAAGPVPVDPRLFSLLARAKAISENTGGAFDVTVGPLVRAWGFMGAAGSAADPEEVVGAREVVGMDLVTLDAAAHSVRFVRDGVMIDLGAIGKGYAIEQAAEILRDLEVGGALIHGGTSSVQAVGSQPDGTPWRVAIQDPSDAARALRVVALHDAALSVSAIHGKYFTKGDTRLGHVLDPRTGAPAQNALLAAVVCQSATDSDALSTALLVAGPSLLQTIGTRPDTGALMACAGPNGLLLETVGLAREPAL